MVLAHLVEIVTVFLLEINGLAFLNLVQGGKPTGSDIELRLAF
jgi:hypothetical protein